MGSTGMPIKNSSLNATPGDTAVGTMGRDDARVAPEPRVTWTRLAKPGNRSSTLRWTFPVRPALPGTPPGSVVILLELPP